MLWEDAINIFDQFIKEETPLDKLQVVLRTMKICSHIYHMASVKDNREMTFDEEMSMMTYIVSKSISAHKLYSNYQFIRLFNIELAHGDPLAMALSCIDAVIQYILKP